jgi:hypothetical protein
MWKAYNLPIDWITFVFMMWNFTGVGVISIFWCAHLVIYDTRTITKSSM